MSGQRLRLAIVRQKYNPFGGAERFVERALNALAAHAALETTLITRDWPGGAVPDGMQIRRCDPFYLGRSQRDRSFSRAVRRELQDQSFDLVQSHERIPGCDLFRAGDGLHRVWLANRARALGWRARLDSLSPYHHYVLAAERAMFRHPALRKVICISEMGRREIREHFDLPEDKLCVIYNGVDLQRFSPELQQHRASTRASLGIPQEVPLLVFVGSGYERKGLARLISALPASTWLLVIGKDKHEKRYHTHAARCGAANRVVFAGPQKDVGPYYGAADAFAMPALYEPFGNVFQEALACGLPILATSACGGAELIEEGVNGFVCSPFDDESLRHAAAQLSAAIAAPTRLAAMRQHARASVTGLSQAVMADKMLALYRSLLP